jgi:predicted dehydrogenase
MKAGKDVYCEKPMVQLISDGPEVIETAKQTGRIFQVGSQRVSSIVYQKAKELLAAGAIGKLTLVEAYWDRNSAIGAWQYSIPPDASPETVDWDRFLGRAPKRPFEPVRLFRWRNYRDYGTGVAGDLFVHLFSGMHYVVDSKVRPGSWQPAVCVTGRTDGMYPMSCSDYMIILRHRLIQPSICLSRLTSRMAPVRARCSSTPAARESWSSAVLA